MHGYGTDVKQRGCEAPDHKRQQGYHLEKFQHQRVSMGAARERNTTGASFPLSEGEQTHPATHQNG